MRDALAVAGNHTGAVELARQKDTLDDEAFLTAKKAATAPAVKCFETAENLFNIERAKASNWSLLPTKDVVQH